MKISGFTFLRNGQRLGYPFVASIRSILPLVDEFVGFFAKEVKENQQLILRWLPGGIVVATITGEEMPAITSPLFARVLWSIWFGKDSIVDRDDLVARIGTN